MSHLRLRFWGKRQIAFFSQSLSRAKSCSKPWRTQFLKFQGSGENRPIRKQASRLAPLSWLRSPAVPAEGEQMKSSSDFGFRHHRGSLTGIGFAFIVFIVVSLLSTVPARTAQGSEETGGEAARVMALETLWNQAEVDKDTR